jgi:hypothetical protein
MNSYHKHSLFVKSWNFWKNSIVNKSKQELPKTKKESTELNESLKALRNKHLQLFIQQKKLRSLCISFYQWKASTSIINKSTQLNQNSTSPIREPRKEKLHSPVLLSSTVNSIIEPGQSIPCSPQREGETRYNKAKLTVNISTTKGTKSSPRKSSLKRKISVTHPKAETKFVLHPPSSPIIFSLPKQKWPGLDELLQSN